MSDKSYLFQPGQVPWNKGIFGCRYGHSPEYWYQPPTGSAYCKVCKHERTARYREKNRNTLRLKNRASRCNIPLEGFYGLWIEEDGFCPICGAWFGDTEFVLDHNHETNEVRGILCYSCNTAIGLFRENQAFLLKAIEYCATRNQGSSKETS